MDPLLSEEGKMHECDIFPTRFIIQDIFMLYLSSLFNVIMEKPRNMDDLRTNPCWSQELII